MFSFLKTHMKYVVFMCRTIYKFDFKLTLDAKI